MDKRLFLASDFQKIRRLLFCVVYTHIKGNATVAKPIIKNLHVRCCNGDTDKYM